MPGVLLLGVMVSSRIRICPEQQRNASAAAKTGLSDKNTLRVASGRSTQHRPANNSSRKTLDIVICRPIIGQQMPDDSLAALQGLGLLPAEAQVYLALVRNGGLSGTAV